MTKKQVVRCIAFLVALLMMVVVLCDLFELENTKNYDQNMYTYRKIPENVIDALYVGTSGVDRYWMGAKAYEEKGMSVYPVSFDAFPSWLYTELLDETLAKQNPKLIIIDVRAFFQNNTNFNRVDVRARRYLDSLPFFSWGRIKAAFKTMEYIHEINPENPRFDASYLFSVIKFHSKWSDDYSLGNNLGSKEQKYGGFFMSKKRSIRRKPHEKVIFNSSKFEELDPISERSLNELIDYIKEKDLKALFVDTPQFLDDKEMGRANTIYKIFEENNLDYLHFYKENSSDFTIDLDNEQDFYDESHVNYYGAEKFTTVLADYISQNYNLPDRRNDNTISEFWNGKYDKIKEKVVKYEAQKAAEESEEQTK